jgi:hypothetical protein
MGFCLPSFMVILQCSTSALRRNKNLFSTS